MRVKGKVQQSLTSYSLPTQICFTILGPTWYSKRKKSMNGHINTVHVNELKEDSSIVDMSSSSSDISTEKQLVNDDNSKLSSSPTETPIQSQHSSQLSHASSYEASTDSDSWSSKKPIGIKKVCMSCGTKNTSRWHKSRFLCSRPRDYFCNACAIRIKKYHLLCSVCYYALNKEQAKKQRCPRCHKPFFNLIDEAEMKIHRYTNQLDTILSGINK